MGKNNQANSNMGKGDGVNGEASKGEEKKDNNGKRDSKDNGPVVPPPDGGWGWMVVLSSFLIHVIADGVVYSFGVFLSEFVDYFDAGRGAVSWVGSLQPAVTFSVGPLSSVLTNHYGCRKVTIAGAIVAALGFILSIWATNLYYLYVTAGVMAGLGFGLIYLPAIVCVAQYFEKKRSFATGLAVCGSGFGTFILAPATEKLVEEYKWQGAMLILGGVILNIVVCGIIFRPLEEPDETESSKSEVSSEEEKLLTNVDPTQIVSVTSQTVSVVVERDFDLKMENQQKDNGNTLLDSERTSKGPSSEVVIISNVGKTHSLEPSGVHRLTASQSLHPTQEETASTRLANMVCSESAIHRIDTDKKNKHLVQRSAHKKSHVTPTVNVKDIQYTGSMHNIPMFCSHPELYKSVASTSSVHQPHDKLAKEEAEEKKGVWQELKQTTAEMLSPELLRNPVFLMFGISNFFTSIGFNVPFIFLPDRAIVSGIDKDRAVLLVSIIGIANTAGRMIFGFLSDRKWVNRLMLYNTALTICGVATALSAVVGDSFYFLAVYAAVFGVFIGVYVSLTPVVLVDLLGLDMLTNSFGLLLLFQGAATFVGPPLAGWLFDWTGSYNISFIVMGILIALSGSMLYFLPCVQRYYKSKDSKDTEA